MTGGLTLEIQQLARPEIEMLLNELGQTVTVRRRGQPDQTCQAFLYQLESKSARVSTPIQLELDVLAWQGIFAHDAPVRDPGFTLLDAAGQLYQPLAPTDDAATQGVALFARLVPLTYRHAGTWSDGTTCRFNVHDPRKTFGGEQLAQRLTGVPDIQAVRLLEVHLDDATPDTRASIRWDGGTLTLEDWSQVSDITGQTIGICRFTR